MATYLANLTAQISAIVADQADGPMVTATAGGESVQLWRGNMRIVEQAVPGGASESIEFSLWTMNEDWTAVPDDGDIVTIDSVEYRVIRHRDYYNGMATRLDMGAKYEAKATGVGAQPNVW